MQEIKSRSVIKTAKQLAVFYYIRFMNGLSLCKYGPNSIINLMIQLQKMKINKLIMLLASFFLFQIGYSQNDTDSLKVDQNKEAEYPGGKKAMFELIGRNLIFPKSFEEANLKGIILLEASLNESGKIVATKVIKSLRSDIDKAALNTLKKLKNFTPAYSNGVAVPSKIQIPVNINIGM